MGYVVSVDGAVLSTAARQLADLGSELRGIGTGVPRALHDAATAAGPGSLAGAASALGAVWQERFGRLAEHGDELSRAMTEAGQTYLEGEQRITQAWNHAGVQP